MLRLPWEVTCAPSLTPVDFRERKGRSVIEVLLIFIVYLLVAGIVYFLLAWVLAMFGGPEIIAALIAAIIVIYGVIVLVNGLQAGATI